MYSTIGNAKSNLNELLPAELCETRIYMNVVTVRNAMSRDVLSNAVNPTGHSLLAVHNSLEKHFSFIVGLGYGRYRRFGPMPNVIQNPFLPKHLPK